MPRRTHHVRLQRMERALGLCECRKPLVLTCLKAIEAHDHGEVAAAEPCPAGCPPEARLAVVLRLSPWRSGEECVCPACVPPEQRRPTVPETVARPALPAPEPAGASAAPADASEAQPGPSDAPAPAAAPEAGFVDGLARDAVLELRRAPVSVPLGGATPQLGPEDVVGGPEPHGPCALPFCKHPLQAHRCYTEQLPCRYCNWPVGAHNGFEPGLPYASRRLWPCGTYLAIRFEGGEHDACTVEGCGCPGWRLRAPYVSKHEEAMRAVRAEKARAIAGEAARRSRLNAEHEERQLELLRAEQRSRREQEHNTPSGAPVFVEKD